MSANERICLRPTSGNFQGIAFVKISNPEEAKEYGIDQTPSLIYFENGIPSVYEG